MPNLNGTSGDDLFTGGSEADTLVGNGGNDSLSGGGGNDLLVGGAGMDTLNGGDGEDKLYSAEESPPFNIPYYNNPWTAPVLDTGTERDTLNGGLGSDRLFAGYGDNVDGGDNGSYGDYLYISFMGASSGVVADFRLKTQVIGGGTITGIENVSWVQGSNYDDDINVGSSSYGYSDFTAVFGMGGNDKLVAGYYTGVLYGGDGNDIVDGRNSQYLQRVDGGTGDDTLYTNTNTFAEAYGGDGNDTIYSHGLTFGGAGNDLIVIQGSYYGGWVYGEAGDDDITASASGSSVAGGDGADKISGDAGADTLFSGNRDPASATIQDDMGREHDVLAGFGGNDILYAGYGDDVDGGSGSDTLRLSLGGATFGQTFSTAGIASGQSSTYAGGTINSIEKLVYLRGSEFGDALTLATQAELLTVDAGAGVDVITSFESSVSVNGGLGDDRFVSGRAGDIFDGGAGFDTVDYSGYGSAVTVSLLGQTGAGGDQLMNTEAVIGSAFGDNLTGDANTNTLRGGSGDDTLDGGGGADTAEYLGVSSDYSWTQASDGSWTVRHLSGADGVDTLKNIERLKFNDTVIQLPVTNFISGSSGNDTLVATSANDQIDGGAGSDTVEFRGASANFSWTQGGDGSWTVKDLRAGSPEGTDTLKNVELLKFTDKLILLGSAPANVILGTSATDNLWGTVGDDVIRGGGDIDFLYGSPGNDTYDGGDGRDLVLFLESPQALRIDLAITGPQNTGEGYDTFESIEQVSGSAYGDVLYGDAGANGLSGQGGDDQLNGRDGDDSLSGDVGDDTLYGGAGNDSMVGGSGDDFIYGEAGDDKISHQSETTDRSLGNDYIDGGEGGDTVWVTYVGFGVSINLSVTTEQQIGAGFTLTIKNVENLDGWQFADRLTGNADGNKFTGWNGDDVIDGGGGVDTVVMRGFSSDYAVTWTPTGWQIADKRPYVASNQLGSSSIYDGVDLVKNVEFIQYYDKTAALGDGMTFVVGNILRQQGASTTATDLSNRLSSGDLTAIQAVSELVTKAGATTSVATLAYQFFTGKIPGQSGVDYLVSPTGPNANNLNSAYYQSFNLENRYINFAVNLGKVGEGKEAFAAKYGALSMVDATREAYKTIFGAAPTDAKIHAMIDSRVDYFAAYGGDGSNGLGTKAAMVGWLLAEAQKADLGVMVRSNDAWLTDLADGSAPFAISLLDPSSGYYKADFIFGGQ
jgi:Ca2+-binding RTX toxin-like protein